MNTLYFIIFSAILYILLSALPCKADPPNAVWIFVVMGNTRDKTAYTVTGVSPGLPKIAAAIVKEQPDFVIHTGDLTNGYHTTQDSPMHEKS